MVDRGFKAAVTSIGGAWVQITDVWLGFSGLLSLGYTLSHDPVWLLHAEKSCIRKVFYVRTNNSTRELSGPDFVSYLRKRWD